MHTIVQAHDLTFRLIIDAAQIATRVQEMGVQITRDFAGKNPLFVVILKGAYIFAADLLRACPIDQEVSFVQLSSYEGISSSKKVVERIPLHVDIKDRVVIIIEDIIDTGRTLAKFTAQLESMAPNELKIATFLHKPDAQEFSLEPDYVGFTIPNDFVIGYGLDYKEAGRHLAGIYQKIED
ncbi:MAG: hypoxanthine phosphoribosyltransferase [Saprospiraceae bacterium]|nr:hypoxanthine phosphoribosyltransferase [Saprospiraceae bacterium]